MMFWMRCSSANRAPKAADEHGRLSQLVPRNNQHDRRKNSPEGETFVHSFLHNERCQREAKRNKGTRRPRRSWLLPARARPNQLVTTGSRRLRRRSRLQQRQVALQARHQVQYLCMARHRRPKSPVIPPVCVQLLHRLLSPCQYPCIARRLRPKPCVAPLAQVPPLRLRTLLPCQYPCKARHLWRKPCIAPLMRLLHRSHHSFHLRHQERSGHQERSESQRTHCHENMPEHCSLKMTSLSWTFHRRRRFCFII